MRSIPAFIQRALLILILALGAHSVAAIQASPFSFAAKQPDGTVVALRIHGDEHYHWLSDQSGFTVVRNGVGQYVYARRAASGELAATTILAGTGDPKTAGLQPRIMPAPEQLARYRSARQITDKTADTINRVPPLGNVTNMVIMIRFADHSGRPLPGNSDITTLFNAVGGDAQLAPTGSIRDVYLENSYGQMTLDSTVFGWVDLPNTEAYYANGSSGDSTLWQALRYALDVVDQTVDFRNFDTDNDNFIDAIAFIHSGYGAEWGGTDQYGATTANRIWSHRWAIQPAWNSNDGVAVFDYHISPGVWSTSGSAIGRIGVIAHETGHFFGLPDLYDTDGNGSGIGSFGLMANSWGFDGSQLYPPHFSPWSKIDLGWLTPTVIDTPGNYALPQAEFNASAYRIDAGFPQNEYLLIENRQPVGFDGAMPQGGLVVWHIDDEAGFNVQGYPGQAGWPGNGNHYRVAVLQADGNYQLEKDINRGDAGDVYHAAGVATIGPQTTPDTDAYQNGIIIETGHVLSGISAAGATMTFDLTGPTPPPAGVASADQVTNYGTPSGTYTATQTQDGAYQSISETQSGGKPANRHDRLDHVWRFDLSGAENRFNVDAYRVDGGDADSGFVFSWSGSSTGPWNDMMTVTATSGGAYLIADLGAIPATVYVRVVDNDRSSGERQSDTIRVDHMFFDAGVPNTDPPGPASNPQPASGATGVATNASVAWTAGSNTVSHDVYFGTTIIPPFAGNQGGTSYDPGTLLNDTTYYWRVDEINANGVTAGATWSFTTQAGGTCGLLGSSCTTNSDCCSNRCKGKNGSKVCK